MRALFIASPTAIKPKRFFKLMLRDGLPPIEDPTLLTVDRNNNGSNRYGIKLTPDQTRGIYFQAGTGAFTYRFNMGPNGWTTDTDTTSAYAGVVNDAFISNDYYGFVGESTSFIVAFRWSNHSVITLDKTGLGAVTRCAMHPNGYSLAVTHANTPFLRIYDLRDGTFINAATALPSQWSTVSWNKAGTALVCANNNTPFVVKYDAALTTRTTLSTNTLYGTSTSSFTGSNGTRGLYSLPHPTKNDCTLVTTTSTALNSKILYEVNTNTNTITDILSYDANIQGVLGFECDPVSNVLYACVELATAVSTLSAFRAWDLTTYAPRTNLEIPGFSMGSAIDPRPMIVINKNYGQVNGTVRDVNNNPVARVVRAYRRSDGLLVGQTTSNATTGDYSMLLPTSDAEAYDIQFMIQSGELLNDLIYARVTPAAIP